jgi:hypothetical protein
MDPPKLSRGKTEVSRERNGFEPEFRGPLVVVNVDMRPFIRFVAVKVHSVGPAIRMVGTGSVSHWGRCLRLHQLGVVSDDSRFLPGYQKRDRLRERSTSQFPVMPLRRTGHTESGGAESGTFRCFLFCRTNIPVSKTYNLTIARYVRICKTRISSRRGFGSQ